MTTYWCPGCGREWTDPDWNPEEMSHDCNRTATGAEDPAGEGIDIEVHPIEFSDGGVPGEDWDEVETREGPP
jgi:hypothetical protein